MESNYLLLLPVLVCFAISFYLISKAGGTINAGKFNIVICVWALFILQTFIGISLIAMGVNKHYTLKYLSERSSAITSAFVMVMITAVLLPLCILIFNRLFRVSAVADYSKYLSIETVNRNDDSVFKTICVIGGVCLILLAGLIVRIGYVPLIRFVSAPNDFNFAIERIRINNTYFINPYITNIFVLQCIPLLSYI